MCELFDQYIRQGRTEGIAEGERKGENRFAKLVQVLMDDGRTDDIRRVVSDQSYRERLYVEVGLL